MPDHFILEAVVLSVNSDGQHQNVVRELGVVLFASAEHCVLVL